MSTIGINSVAYVAPVAIAKRPASAEVSVAMPNPVGDSSLQTLSHKFDLENMTGSQIQQLAGSLKQSGEIDSHQMLTLMVIAGVNEDMTGPIETSRNLVQSAHEYLGWATTNEPKTAIALQGLLSTFQTLSRLKDGQPADYWVA